METGSHIVGNEMQAGTRSADRIISQHYAHVLHALRSPPYDCTLGGPYMRTISSGTPQTA